MSLPRSPQPLTGRRCFCGVCGLLFLSPESFDIHRGIRPRRDEEAHDLGRCLSTVELAKRGIHEYETGVYGTEAEIQTALKFRAMRGQGE